MVTPIVRILGNLSAGPMAEKSCLLILRHPDLSAILVRHFSLIHIDLEFIFSFRFTCRCLFWEQITFIYVRKLCGYLPISWTASLWSFRYITPILNQKWNQYFNWLIYFRRSWWSLIWWINWNILQCRLSESSIRTLCLTFNLMEEKYSNIGIVTWDGDNRILPWKAEHLCP